MSVPRAVSSSFYPHPRSTQQRVPSMCPSVACCFRWLTKLLRLVTMPVQSEFLPFSQPQVRRNDIRHGDRSPGRHLSSPQSAERPPIFFYHKHDPHYGFTNFSDHPVSYQRMVYPTSEHLFQSLKVNDVHIVYPLY